jgi:hypothetical protein
LKEPGKEILCRVLFLGAYSHWGCRGFHLTHLGASAEKEFDAVLASRKISLHLGLLFFSLDRKEPKGQDGLIPAAQAPRHRKPSGPTRGFGSTIAGE